MAAAAEALIRCVYEGCISGCDSCFERRPYHRNCGCALHKLRKGCPHAPPRTNNISYTIRRSWSEGCLALMASANGTSPSLSPYSSPVRTTTTIVREVDKNL
ncbi:hypothetical protein MLD38_014450 [Melastoma candidum]|uniref:Uncharacterized protein n=1 Tax=Melastoma candidum TaxID=119954 RepID=A0ACB9REP8_9MYRT|nr:hypothetical protein MLD38_014450 [Melastoma candidum]